MYRYIRADNETEKAKRELILDISVIAFVDEITVTSSEETFNLPIADRKIANEIDKEYDEIVYHILGILHSFRYQELEHHRSSHSDSLYFTFCRESEFDIEEVTLIIRMRVSDHPLPRWHNDKSKSDAESRSKNKLQEFSNGNKFLNTKLADDEDIEGAIILVEYEHEYYNVYEDMFKEIRKALRKFKRKHE